MNNENLSGVSIWNTSVNKLLSELGYLTYEFKETGNEIDEFVIALLSV